MVDSRLGLGFLTGGGKETSPEKSSVGGTIQSMHQDGEAWLGVVARCPELSVKTARRESRSKS